MVQMAVLDWCFWGGGNFGGQPQCCIGHLGPCNGDGEGWGVDFGTLVCLTSGVGTRERCGSTHTHHVYFLLVFVSHPSVLWIWHACGHLLAY